METPKTNSVFILKLIGSLFSIISLVLSGFILWMLLNNHEIKAGSEYKSFLISLAILNAATATIAVFIWWIVSNKNKFLNYD